MLNYRLGKNWCKVDARTLRLVRYLAPSLPAPPAAVAWQKISPSGGWDMDSNAKLGDCVVARVAHQIEAWTYNSNPQRPVNVSEGQGVGLYQFLSPSNDGVAILDFLKHWQLGVPLGSSREETGSMPEGSPPAATTSRASKPTSTS